jgi:inosose dehydratase
MTIRFANAPVSWGIWGTQSLPPGRSPEDILDAVEKAGYDGIELGPLGFFGTATEVASSLLRHHLDVAGAYVPLRVFGAKEDLRGDFDALRQVCEAVWTCGGDAPVILAEETSDDIKRAVRRGASRPDLELSDAQWDRLTSAITDAKELVASCGLPTSYHPHAGTHIEQPHEVDRLLDSCDIGLTIDTAHAFAGGDDPLALLRRWSGRVNHVHLKDAVEGPILDAQRSGFPFSIASASRALGEGELDLDAFLAELIREAYSGWIVVEQDRRPDGGHDHSQVDLEQARNLDWLRTHIRN